MKKIKYILIIILTVIILGCIKHFGSPSLENADTFLKYNQHDIDVVVNYIKAINTKDNSVYIKGISVYYEFEEHNVLDDEIKDSLQRLLSVGCESISLDKENNTLCFEIWSRTFGDISCGISQTLDGNGYPKAEFQTECKPISDGWFYYCADYEAYRKNPSKYDEMW